MLAAADEAVASCDVFMSIGTSSVVYPAAGFVKKVKHHCPCKLHALAMIAGFSVCVVVSDGRHVWGGQTMSSMVQTLKNVGLLHAWPAISSPLPPSCPLGAPLLTSPSLFNPACCHPRATAIAVVAHAIERLQRFDLCML